MKLKTILMAAATLAATASVATTAFAATYTFAGFDQGFALVKDENGNVRPGAELKDGKADLTKYGLGVIDTNQESPVTDKEKEQIFAPSEEEQFIKDKGLDKDLNGNPSVRLDNKKDDKKPTDTKTPTDTKKSDDKKAATDDANKAKDSEKNLPQGKTTPKELPKTSAVK